MGARARAGRGLGGFATFDQRSGVFAFLSYRDPNLLKTLDNYDGAAGFLRTHNLSEIEMTKCIIGVIGDMDGHELPDARGFAATTRSLLGTTDAILQQLRDEVLATTPADIVAFADVLTRLNASGQIVVVGPAGAFDTANQSLVPGLAVTKVL